MRANLFVVLGALSLLPGTALAAAPAQPEAKSASWAPGAELVEQASKLSDGEKLDKAREALARIREAVAAVTRTQQEAFASKDKIRLNCVEDKLMQVKGAQKIAESAASALDGAAARKESATANGEYARVAMARQKAEQLQAEAAQCVGPTSGKDGKGSVEVEEPEGQTATGASLRVANPASRPPAASPTN